jgi:hypothetical protein
MGWGQRRGSALAVVGSGNIDTSFDQTPWLSRACTSSLTQSTHRLLLTRQLSQIPFWLIHGLAAPLGSSRTAGFCHFHSCRRIGSLALAAATRSLAIADSTLTGDGGNDTISGGAGKDTMTSSAGND